jgi:DNA-binding CsgD family transcriptional regulator
VVEPLSDREREVLRHLSGMRSTAEIASELYISVKHGQDAPQKYPP